MQRKDSAPKGWTGGAAGQTPAKSPRARARPGRSARALSANLRRAPAKRLGALAVGALRSRGESAIPRTPRRDGPANPASGFGGRARTLEAVPGGRGTVVSGLRQHHAHAAAVGRVGTRSIPDGVAATARAEV